VIRKKSLINNNTAQDKWCGKLPGQKYKLKSILQAKKKLSVIECDCPGPTLQITFPLNFVFIILA